jgi:hypothetical protein
MIRRLIVVLALQLVAVGCSNTSADLPHASPSDAATCAVSSLEKGPDEFSSFGITHAGPIWFSAFGQMQPGTNARLVAGGGPYDGWKVVIHPARGSTGIVELSGLACATGSVVRFCYTDCSWDRRLQVAVTNLRIDTGAASDYTGYMIFPSSGLMRLRVSKGSQPLGQTVIDVPRSTG